MAVDDPWCGRTWAKHHWHRLFQHLVALAETTKDNTLAAGKPEDLAAGYAVSGWKADDAVIRALSLVEQVR